MFFLLLLLFRYSEVGLTNMNILLPGVESFINGLSLEK